MPDSPRAAAAPYKRAASADAIYATALRKIVSRAKERLGCMIEYGEPARYFIVTRDWSARMIDDVCAELRAGIKDGARFTLFVGLSVPSSARAWFASSAPSGIVVRLDERAPQGQVEAAPADDTVVE